MLKRTSISTLIAFYALFSSLWAQEEFFKLAKKYESEGKYNLALDTYEMLAQKNPGTIIAHRAKLHSVDLLLHLGDTSRAILILSDLTKEPLVDSVAEIVYSKLTSLTNDPLRRGRILLDFAIKYPSSPKRLKYLELAGLEFVKAKAFNEALKPYKILSTDYPEKRRRAQIKLGFIRKCLGDAGRAELLLRRYEDDTEARYYLVKLLLENGDTAGALFLLMKDAPGPLKRQKFRLLLALGDYKGVLREIEGVTDQIDYVDYKAKALLKLGRVYELGDLLQHIKDTVLLAEIYLTTGEPSAVLSLLKDMESPKAKFLKAEAFLLIGSYFQAYENLQQLPDSLEYNQAKVKLALALKDMGLWKDAMDLLAGLRNYFPKEEVTQLEYDLLLLRGDSITAKELENEMISYGICPLPSVTCQDLLNIYRESYGKPPYYLLKSLYNIGAYEEIWETVDGRKLTLSEAEIVTDALVKLFRATCDTYYAERAEKIFSQMPSKPVSYLELHAFWNPAAADVQSFKPEDLDSTHAYYLALIEAQKGNREKALEILRRCSGGLLERGLFYINLFSGRLDSAYAYLNEKNLIDVLQLAKAYYKSGDKEVAKELLDLIRPCGYSLDRDVSFLKIRCLQEIENWNELKEEARYFISTFIGDENIDTVKKLLALAYLKTGEPGKAFVTLYPFEDNNSRNLKATALLQLGKPELALELQPPDSEILWEAAFLAGDTTIFTTYFPTKRKNIERLLEYYASKGDTAKVKKLTAYFSGKGLIDSDLRNYYLAEAFTRSGAEERAKAFSAKLSEYHRAMLSYEQGLTLFRNGELEKAKTKFFAGIQWGDAELRGKSAFKLASVYFSEKRFREAAEYYKMAFSLLKDSLLLRNALYNIAVSYKNLGEADSAIAYYKKVAELFSDTEDALDALFSLAYYLEERGELEKAINYFKDLEGELRKPQDEVELLFWMGETYTKLGEYRNALDCFRRIYIFHPDMSNWAVTAKLEAARAFASIGEKEKARTLLESIVRERGETDDFGKAALEQLKTLTP